MLEILNFIDGAFVRPASDEWLDLVEPATGGTIGRIADSTAEDVDRAVAAAKRAFPSWKSTPTDERSRLLERLADLIEANRDELAELESRDSGKPVSLARSIDIPRAVLNFRFFAGAVRHDFTEFHQTDGVALNYTLRHPLGVAGLISPWNLPLYLLTWKIAPAIATGNTCVAKPSELTPLTAMRLGELANEAGIPPGVINIIHGRGARAGAALTGHPDVPLISFTGGTATGKLIQSSTGPLFKKVSLELGGKNPNIIFADADLDEAIPASIRSSFANQGEICLCGSRIFVGRSIHDRFVEQFAEQATKLRVGDPRDDGTDVGALISSAHRDKVEGYIRLAQKEGGTIATGGGRPDSLPGRVLRPTSRESSRRSTTRSRSTRSSRKSSTSVRRRTQRHGNRKQFQPRDASSPVAHRSPLAHILTPDGWEDFSTSPASVLATPRPTRCPATRSTATGLSPATTSRRRRVP